MFFMILLFFGCLYKQDKVEYCYLVNSISIDSIVNLYNSCLNSRSFLTCRELFFAWLIKIIALLLHFTLLLYTQRPERPNPPWTLQVVQRASTLHATPQYINSPSFGNTWNLSVSIAHVRQLPRWSDSTYLFILHFLKTHSTCHNAFKSLLTIILNDYEQIYSPKA